LPHWKQTSRLTFSDIPLERDSWALLVPSGDIYAEG